VNQESQTRNPKQEKQNTNMSTEVATVKKDQIANQSGLSIDAADIDIQRINIVQKTSDIEAAVGSVVLDKKYVLLKAEETTEVVVLSALKGWREDIPYDDDGIPRIAYTQEEKESLASQSDYDMLEFAEIVLLFPQPKEGVDDDTYPYPIGERQYAMGKLNVAKDAYRQTYKRLATFAAFNRTTPLQSRLWNFQSGIITKGKYSWYAPSLSITQNSPDPAVIEFASTFGQ
jgi:hypothetical protein